MLLTMVDDTLLLLSCLSECIEFVLLTCLVAIVVKQRLVKILAKCINLHVELDHIGGFVSLEGDNKNSLTIGLYKLGDIVVIAFRIGFFKQFLKVVREILIADNQVFLAFMYSRHSHCIWEQ